MLKKTQTVYSDTVFSRALWYQLSIQMIIQWTLKLCKKIYEKLDQPWHAPHPTPLFFKAILSKVFLTSCYPGLQYIPWVHLLWYCKGVEATLHSPLCSSSQHNKATRMLMQVNQLYCLADNFKMQQVGGEKFSCLPHMHDVMPNIRQKKNSC